jgi:hypothetical protein
MHLNCSPFPILPVNCILFSLYNLPEDFIPEKKTLETEKNPVTGSVRKRHTRHVYKIPSADPAFKYLPSGSL